MTHRPILQHRRQRAALHLCCALLLTGVLSCGGDEQAVVQVKRRAPSVWAGSPAALPPPLEHDEWQEVEEGGAIKTDSDGEAEIQTPSCSAPLLLTRDSNVQVAACREGLQPEGLACCAREGSVYFSGTCEEPLTLDTFSGRITATQATLAASFVSLRRLTLVIVMEGEVTVQPVTDYRSGELGPGTSLPAGHFLYTMPGDVSPEIRDIPARVPRPLKELPAVAKALFIQRSMQALGQLAESDGVLPEDWPNFGEPSRRPTYLVLLGQGGPLEDPAVQEALVAAIGRKALGQSTERLELLAEVGGAIIEAQDIAYDPNAARATLAAAGYADGFAVDLLYFYSWLYRGMYEIGEEFALDLRAVGLDVELLSYGEQEILGEIQKRTEAGEPVLWLEVW